MKLEQIESIVVNFWASAPSNSLQMATGEKAWEKPQLAVARGDDPLFARHKELIGDFFWTPQEAFALAFPDAAAPAEELRVISWVLPQTAATKADQQQEAIYPAERWARSRYHGEAFNRELRLHLADQLTSADIQAVAPERLPGFGYRQSPRYGIASNWSERHAAFVAGHGTFSLSDAMITRWGKAVRFGSVVARLDLPATERVYGDDIHAWCLWYAKGICGACARRCPAEAITLEAGHDKAACKDYIRGTTAPYVTRSYGIGDTPCGLCQVKIPCESSVPKGLMD